MGEIDLHVYYGLVGKQIGGSFVEGEKRQGWGKELHDSRHLGVFEKWGGNKQVEIP